MAVNYAILDYTVKALVEQLMQKYHSSFDSSLEMVLNSHLYTRLLEDSRLLEEGDIYLFDLLVKELPSCPLECSKEVGS
jgi:hypothetical protein